MSATTYLHPSTSAPLWRSATVLGIHLLGGAPTHPLAWAWSALAGAGLAALIARGRHHRRAAGAAEPGHPEGGGHGGLAQIFTGWVVGPAAFVLTLWWADHAGPLATILAPAGGLLAGWALAMPLAHRRGHTIALSEAVRSARPTSLARWGAVAVAGVAGTLALGNLPDGLVLAAVAGVMIGVGAPGGLVHRATAARQARAEILEQLAAVLQVTVSTLETVDWAVGADGGVVVLRPPAQALAHLDGLEARAGRIWPHLMLSDASASRIVFSPSSDEHRGAGAERIRSGGLFAAPATGTGEGSPVSPAGAGPEEGPAGGSPSPSPPPPGEPINLTDEDLA